MTEENAMKGLMCPYRQGHYCSKCVWYNKKMRDCTINLMNRNLGRIAHALEDRKMGDKPAKDKGS